MIRVPNRDIAFANFNSLYVQSVTANEAHYSLAVFFREDVTGFLGLRIARRFDWPIPRQQITSGSYGTMTKWRDIPS